MNIKHHNMIRSLAGDNSELILQFLITFSRFEYALKRAGFLENREYASPDWDSFARGIEAKFANIQDPEFIKAKTYLRQYPPQKQIVKMPEKELDWDKSPQIVEDNATCLLRLVRRVRNNLFHGGKYPYKPVSERELRNRDLLQACLTILETCLSLDDKVKRFFETIYAD